MPMDMTNPNTIAAELNRVYPDIVRVSLSLNDLRALIENLPDYKSPRVPLSENALNHILWTWMRLADEKIMTGDVA